MTIKFAFVVACFCMALVSYFFYHSRRDWAWLAGGLAFTVGADYFLVIHDWHLPGVAVFVFAHVCYIFRGLEARLGRKLSLFWLVAPILAVMLGVYFDSLFFLAGLYALLFLVNIVIWIFVNKKTRQRSHMVMLVGLVLFALCDVNVLLFNLPRYLGFAPLPFVFYLIWIFYLPAQVLICASGMKFFSKTR